MTEKEFNRLFYTYYKPLVWFAHRILQDKDDAQEAVQWAFVKIHQVQDSLHGNYRMIKSYLYATVHNRACDMLKERIKEKKSVAAQPTDQGEPPALSFDLQVQIDLNQQLYEWVNSLPEKCREVFVLLLKGHEVGAISKITKANIHTIKNQRARGLKLLRKRMQHLADAY